MKIIRCSFLFVTINIYYSNCCSCKFFPKKSEADKLKEAIEKANEFKDKLFNLLQERVDDSSYYGKFNADNESIGENENGYASNFDIIKVLQSVNDCQSNSGKIKIILPKRETNNNNFSFSKEDNLIKIKNEGVVVFFYFENDEGKVIDEALYVYHKGLKQKLNAIKFGYRETVWHYRGYKFIEGNISDENENYLDGSWVIQRSTFPNKDLMKLTFHREKVKSPIKN